MLKATILAIETSCDDTSIALLECSGTLRQAQGKTLHFKVLENIVSSQIAIHRPFGGVVPNLAKREHIKNLPKILKNLQLTTYNLQQIDYIAVTVGPGLEPALWTGINFAEELAKTLNKRSPDPLRGFRAKKTKISLIGVNHMEGHLFSCFLPQTKSSDSVIPHLMRNPEKKLDFRLRGNDKIRFPAIALIVSGGHTILLNMKSINKWEKLGETLDDAAGEAFDKVAKMLKLPYPGGPEISKLAIKGNPKAINFPRPMLNRPNYDFSFSGLKTSVLYYLRDHQEWTNADTESQTNAENKSPRKSASGQRKSAFKADVAASFQEAVVDVLNKKTARAAKEYKAKSILLCGGVSANKLLRERLKNTAKEFAINFIVPDFKYSVDNAAMIAAAAYINLLQKNKKRLPMEADGNLNI